MIYKKNPAAPTAGNYINIENDIVPAILSGKIIEEYPDYYPYKSYPVLGVTIKLLYLHVVCSIGQDKLWIITEYLPDKKRKERI